MPISRRLHILFSTCTGPRPKLVQAFKGGEGIALMKSGSPDLVILDLGLPDIDGMKVLKEIR